MSLRILHQKYPSQAYHIVIVRNIWDKMIVNMKWMKSLKKKKDE